MTAIEFNKLGFEEKYHIWNSEGSFLDEHLIYNKVHFVLYSVRNFYVMVKYNIQDNTINEITALENIKDIDIFTNKVDLNKLQG